MSKVPLRSFAVLVLLVIAGCKSRDGVRPIFPRGCGSANHDTPVVCVDGSGGTIKVIPDSIRVWNVAIERSRDAAHDSVDHARRWRQSADHDERRGLRRDARLQRQGSLRREGRSRDLGRGATAGTIVKRCKYTVTLDGRVLDPETVVVGCCSDLEPIP